MSRESIIEVFNLEKSFGEIRAVKGISFSVKKGSLFAFLGRNGAGKSTTINMLCSILKKDGGRVFIDGLDLDSDAGSIKKKIGIVFQSSVLDAQLTVLENLKARASLYSLSRHEADNQIAHLAEMLDFEPILRRNYKVLSGGQKRRIDIARALIHKPSILFLDEPTTGLDPATRIKVWEIIDRLRKEQDLTVFLTTHYMEEAAKSDWVVIIDGGEIAASGAPDYLKSSFTKDFLRIIRKKDNELEEVLNEHGREYEYRNNSYYIIVNSASDAIKAINDFERFLVSFEVLKGDMDNVFLNITGKKIEEDM